MSITETCGILLVQSRANYMADVKSSVGFLLFDGDEGHDLRTRGVPFAQCIRRPDGIVIYAKHLDTTYDIHFHESDSDIGGYRVSHGPFAGKGRIFKVRRGDSPSFSVYYYIRVVSSRSVEFAWRVGINRFSQEVEAEPSADD
jgi:hypothetical protein